MGLVTRLGNSIRTRGLGPTLHAAKRHVQTAISMLADSGYDRSHGVRTSGVVEIEEMRDVQSPRLSRGMRYEPTRANPFRRIMRSLALPTDGTFVDVGCGRGRVLIMAAELGFQNVIGIEYSPELCRVARQNLVGAARGADIRVIEQDAALYSFERDQTVIYMFNPFGTEVMTEVLDRIDVSLEAAPRTMWLVYQYPEARHAIESRATFSPIAHACYGGCEFIVYRNH